ncbi:GNAT family N-acetyltransferase [Hyphococcus flavus]|uniref:GNAT family N-acetyltransferase n=1 Tax=Hyphococcus flavus TaxID=1866326 RepID=A0AAF0CBD6_9PROT|nr:GNAT family N-acetyltransferase [Hyphococcus flavus]WDI30700.1 GNAT family N-acetyltransferase [Hyphococcus flavus]
MKLRTAVAEDIPLLKAWDENSHVRDASGEDSDYDWDEEIPRIAEWGELLMAEDDGRAIGFMEIIDPALEPTGYWGDVGEGLRAVDIWIGEEKHLGQGFGTQMMRLALERCFADPNVKAVIIDPLERNTRARRFYERLGFKFVEYRTFEKELCAIYRLERADYLSLAEAG